MNQSTRRNTVCHFHSFFPFKPYRDLENKSRPTNSVWTRKTDHTAALELPLTKAEKKVNSFAQEQKQQQEENNNYNILLFPLYVHCDLCSRLCPYDWTRILTCQWNAILLFRFSYGAVTKMTNTCLKLRRPAKLWSCKVCKMWPT